DALKSILEGADTSHQNPTFNYPDGIGIGIAEQAQRQCTLLPSVLPRPEYSSPPNTPELLRSKAQNYSFSLQTLEKFCVSDFERPGRRAVLSPTSSIR